VLRLDAQAALVAGLQALQGQLEAGQQVAVTELESGRLLVEGAVDQIAVFQLEGEMQGNFLVRADADVSHWVSPDCLDVNMSMTSMMAPTVMALSARLKAGKCQRFCQCTRMKSMTWPKIGRAHV